MGEINNDYRHVYDFFELLEKETNLANPDNSIRMRTASAYAEKLNLHTNYLNELVKKHTGQPISTLIKNRLLEESKALLVRTGRSWKSARLSALPTSRISASFFKRYVGVTPNDFRRSAHPLPPIMKAKRP